MGTPQTRRDIIEKILTTYKVAKAQGVQVDTIKFMALISVERGCTQRKAKEYIQTLKDAKLLIETPSGLEYSEQT